MIFKNLLWKGDIEVFQTKKNILAMLVGIDLNAFFHNVTPFVKYYKDISIYT